MFELIRPDTQFDFVGKMKAAVIASVAFILIGIASVVFHGGLNLGVDFAEVTPKRLARALAGRRGVLKSALLDQHVVAGLGNLCVDEVLWGAGRDPRRTVDSLDEPEVDRLASTIRRRLPIMLARGGSTTGVLSPAVRAACPPCERDGAPLERLVIGGRTTVWCPRHQR